MKWRWRQIEVLIQWSVQVHQTKRPTIRPIRNFVCAHWAMFLLNRSNGQTFFLRGQKVKPYLCNLGLYGRPVIFAVLMHLLRA